MAATDPKKQGLPDLPNVTGYTDKNYAGGQMDEFGFTETIPGSNLAPYQQFQADRITRQRQEGFFQQAEQSQREGLGNLQTYRPGGAAALTSPYYQNMSNVLVARANAQYSPDLMHYWRWNQAHRARKASKRAALLAGIGSVAQTLQSAAGAAAGAAGSYGAAASTNQGALADNYTKQNYGFLSSDQPASTTGPMQGPAGMSPFGATQGAPGVSRGTGGPQTPGGGGQQQPVGPIPQFSGAGTGTADESVHGGPGLPMAGGGLPPTEHPLGFQFGMAANLGSDMGVPNDQMLAMTMVDEDVGGPNGMPMLDFAELQLDQMFFTLHEILQGDPSLGGYG